jgi:hypothetical protein
MWALGDAWASRWRMISAGCVRKVRKVRKVFSLFFWEKSKYGERVSR